MPCVPNSPNDPSSPSDSSNLSPMTLLTLASRQIWPQVLTVAHLKPQRLFLLPSDDAQESRGPAQRLKRFFDHTQLVPPGGSRLELIPHDHFNALEQRFDDLAAQHRLNLGQCLLNFTGGNKLMATAAFRWAAKRSVRSFYLERGNTLTWFEPRDGELLTRTEHLNGHLTDTLNAVDLLRCQLDASELERPGQTLTLNNRGRAMPEAEFYKRADNGNPLQECLAVTGEADHESKAGDPLEFNAAAVLLKLGVPRVHRSLRLKVKSSRGVSSRRPHAEIDLLFNWHGRLWLVDCKDRLPAENLVPALRRHLPQTLNAQANELLQRIQDELTIGQTKVLKEDLLAVREAGGLLGTVVCVRKADLPEEVKQFAAHNDIRLVAKNDLVEAFRALLYPDRPPTPAALSTLVVHFHRAAEPR